LVRDRASITATAAHPLHPLACARRPVAAIRQVVLGSGCWCGIADGPRRPQRYRGRWREGRHPTTRGNRCSCWSGDRAPAQRRARGRLLRSTD